ncbi:MAG: LysR family transcriptional regulator [Deltaproteobacteria bacterium]|nr:LysR family transcriptional regulator [Deltaproteobacteria bacterium]
MDLNEIVVFARVVETRSFTAAAQQLGLPKSTVSRKVAQLEERLGVRLLQRTTRKLNLTEVGTAYYERCARIVSDIASAEQVVTEMQTAPRGLLRVTAPVDFGATYLGPLVAEFVAQYPDIAVDVDVSDRIVDLIEDAVDLGIRFGPLSESSLVARKLGVVRMRLCAARTYLARRGTPTHPSELADHDLVAFVPTARMQTWPLRGPDGTVEVSPRAKIVSNSVKVVHDAVMSGAGIAVLPEFVFAEEEVEGTMVPVLPDWAMQEGDLFAVYPSTRNLSPKVRAFLEFLVAKMNPVPWDCAARAARMKKASAE